MVSLGQQNLFHMEFFYLISITTLIILFIMFIIINHKIKRIRKQKENYSNHSKKSDNINHSLKSVFTVAEKGMYNIDFPISQEGRFEIAMFDIWVGTMLMKEQHINIDYKLMQNKIEEYLKQTALKLGLPVEKKYMMTYIFREEGWEHDVMGLIHSDYPQTKQFLPAYMYLCIVAHPLLVFDEETTEKKLSEIPTYELCEFLGPFCEHYSWLVKTIIKSIK